MLILDQPPQLILPDHWQAKRPAIIRPAEPALLEAAAIPGVGAALPLQGDIQYIGGRTTVAVVGDTFNLPTAYNADDMLVVALAKEGSGTAITLAGWTTIESLAVGTDRWMLAYKRATGAEGTTQAFTHTGTNNAYAGCMAFRNVRAVYASTAASGTSTSADPPSFSPSPGSKRYAWLAAAIEGSSSTNFTGGPSGYTTSLLAAHALLSYKITTAASEDPGACSIAASVAWRALTLALEPY